MQSHRRFSRGIATIVCLWVTGCASGGQSDAAAKPAIGWLHGACIGLTEPDVLPGTPIAVVRLDAPQAVLDATIAAKAQSGETCAPLMDDRRDVNLAQGLTFYQLDMRVMVELGIGVVRRLGDRALTGVAGLDTNGDGRGDTFTHCTTSEGVQFSIWAGAPHVGDPLWRGYYYLGYDTQADCPSE